MKRLFTLLLFLLVCLAGEAQTVNVIYSLANPALGLTAISNQTATIQAFTVPNANAASVLFGPPLRTNTGNGTFTNVQAVNMIYGITITDPTYGTPIGKFAIMITNLSGTIQANTNLIPWPLYGTFPAGSVAWAAATSDLRYAPYGAVIPSNSVFAFGTNVFTATNSFTVGTIFSGPLILGGVPITSWPTNNQGTVVTNFNGLTNESQTFATGTTGSDFGIVSATGTHTFNLPPASATASGKLASADWTTFNGKQSGNTNLTNYALYPTNVWQGAAGFNAFTNTLGGAAFVSTNQFQSNSANLSNFAQLTTNAFQNATAFNAFTNSLGSAAFVPTNRFQSNSANLSNFAQLTTNAFQNATAFNTFTNSLGTAAFQPTNAFQSNSAVLSNYATLPTNGLVFVTNGASSGQTLTNSVIKGTWTAATGAASGYVWTSDIGGAATWQPPTGGSGGGIPTSGGSGTNTFLTNAAISNSTAGTRFTILAPNQGAAGNVGGLILSNSTAAHYNPNTNQPSPTIILAGSALGTGNTSIPNSIYISNSVNSGSDGTGQFAIGDNVFGTFLTADSANGLSVNPNGSGNGVGFSTSASTPLLASSFAGSGNRIPFFDNFGNLAVPATTDQLPQGSTNKWYSNSLVQAFSDIRYQRKGIKTVTTTYTTTTNDYTVICDTTGGGFTVTLPAASLSTNLWVFKNIGSNPLLVATIGVDHIEGYFFWTNNTLNQSDVFQSDGSGNYRLLAEYGGTNVNSRTFITTLGGVGTNTTLNGTVNVTNLGTSNSNPLVLLQNNTNVLQIAQAAFGLQTTLQGFANVITNTVSNATILGGVANTISGGNQVGGMIVGGNGNVVSNILQYGAIFGGFGNIVNGLTVNGQIFGGLQNTITSNSVYSTILGGRNNLVSNANYSAAMGRNATANKANTFVWSDGTAISTATSNTFIIAATNGVGINTNNPGTNALSVLGGVLATWFAGDAGGLTNLLSTNGGAQLFVSTNGNDLIATRGGLQAFKTLTAAATASQSGDTIMVSPGVYAENNLCANVTWQFAGPTCIVSNTANYWNNVGAASTNALFHDSDTVTNFNIIGWPTLYFDSGTNVWGYTPVVEIATGIGATNAYNGIHISNAATRAFIQFDDFRFRSFLGGPNPSAIFIENCSNVSIDFHTMTDLSYASNYLFVRQTATHGLKTNSATSAAIVNFLGESHVHGKRIYPFAVYGCAWEEPPGSNHTNNLYYNIDEVDAKMYGGVFSPSYRTWMNIGWLNRGIDKNSAAGALGVQGGFNYYNGQKISEPNVGVDVSVGAVLWMNLEKLEGSNQLLHVSNATTNETHINIQHYADGGGLTNAIQIEGGTNFIEGGTMKPGAAIGINIQGGTNAMKNMTVDTSLGGATNNWPLLISGGSNTTAGCSFISASGTFPVFALTAQNLYSFPDSYCSSTVAPNVTVAGNIQYPKGLFPYSGITGITNNTLATAGNVGEVVSNYVAVGSGVTCANNVVTNVTSISLTAGDWDVEGNVNFSSGTTSTTGAAGGITTVTATLPGDGSEVYSGITIVGAIYSNSVTLPRKVINVNTTTTVYLEGMCSFTAGTVKASGGITARRVR